MNPSAVEVELLHLCCSIQWTRNVAQVVRLSLTISGARDKIKNLQIFWVWKAQKDSVKTGSKNENCKILQLYFSVHRHRQESNIIVTTHSTDLNSLAMNWSKLSKNLKSRFTFNFTDWRFLNAWRHFSILNLVNLGNYSGESWPLTDCLQNWKFNLIWK